MINDNRMVNMGILVTLAVFSLCILIIAFVLCGDIYGAGPAFVAVTNGLALCGYASYLLYATSRSTLNVHLNFGLSVVVTVSALQQAVMWGGLTEALFQSRMLNLTVAITDAAGSTCVGNCDFDDVQVMVAALAALPQKPEAERAMCGFQVLLFLVWIPYTVAQYFARNDASTEADNLDYSSKDYTAGASETSSADYTDL